MKRPIYAFSSLVALASPLAAQPLCETMLGTQAFDYQSICVSSALAPQSGNRYDIGSMRDANDYTAWCEGVPGPGIGEQITLSYRFAGPLERIWISNGYAKSPKSFADNGLIEFENYPSLHPFDIVEDQNNNLILQVSGSSGFTSRVILIAPDGEIADELLAPNQLKGGSGIAVDQFGRLVWRSLW